MGRLLKVTTQNIIKKRESIKLKQKVKATDNKNNKILTDQAEYDQNTKVFKSFKSTEIVTSENYILRGKNITVDNKDFIISEDQSILEDTEGNKIYLENFTYNVRNRIFKSIGLIRIEDKFDNSYEFTQIYIDTKKKELLGNDIKSYLNNDKFKINKKNKPRIFANTVRIKEKENLFNKSVFTICDYRKMISALWTIQASKMLHDNIKKTIYYDNALSKFTIFQFFIYQN